MRCSHCQQCACTASNAHVRLQAIEYLNISGLVIDFATSPVRTGNSFFAKRRYAADPFNKLIVSYDMTVSERSECKKLVAEAKIQESNDHSGEWIYRVRGIPGQMRIVKLCRAY